MNAVVLIPSYKSDVSSDELASLRQCRRVLASHDCKVFHPEGWPLPDAFAGLQSEPFPACYFRSISDYNRLMLSLEFYDRFQAYDYILIHQLDAYVFRDELTDWCARGFDYVGAPWGHATFPGKAKSRRSLPWYARPLWLARLLYWRDFRVGNGGLSLRCTRTFRRILQKHSDVADRWLRNEDEFWSLVAPVYDRHFRIPCERQAMRFSLELEPRQYVNRMGGRLPFGCHAWRKRDPSFWTPYLPTLEAE